MLGRRQINNRLNRGVDELRCENHRDRQHENRPVARGKFQPETDSEDSRGNNSVNPRVALGLQNIPPAAEGVSERGEAGEEEGFHGREEKMKDE